MDAGDESKYYYYEDLPSNDTSSYTLTNLPPPSSPTFVDNGASFFFTAQPKRLGWNSRNSHATVIKENPHDEDVFEDHVVGKSYDAFESKLQQGFLEAPNLGLVSVPPAMFDYQPPLQDNKIEILPDHFFDELPNLTWCDLRYNRLHSLPPVTIEHKNLKVLLLQNNQLQTLPYSLARAKCIHTIGWTNNDISDPPRLILLEGCQSILEYLRTKLETLLLIQEGKPITFDHDEQLAKDLKKTAKKQGVRRTKSRNSLWSNESKIADNVKKEEDEKKRRIDRLKYTWNLWKSIPYNGMSQDKLFASSVEEVKDDIKTKFNQHRDAVLQKIKDKDVLGKWRKEAKMLQMEGPDKQYDGVRMPFGTDADDNIQETRHGHVEVDPATFSSNMAECMKRLQFMANNPAPISDTEKSLERLKEVEDIQRKLLDMKLKWSVKSSNPI